MKRFLRLLAWFWGLFNEPKTENEKGLTPLIHPKFKIRWNYWQQNREGLLAYLKVSFTFDDPGLLDDCPFVCKIAPHDDPKVAAYFGIAFALPYEVDRLKEWTARFKNRELRTPGDMSRVLQKLS